LKQKRSAARSAASGSASVRSLSRKRSTAASTNTNTDASVPAIMCSACRFANAGSSGHKSACVTARMTRGTSGKKACVLSYV